MQCKRCYRTGALPCKVRVVGSIPLPGTGFSFVFLHFYFPAFLTLCVYLGVCVSVAYIQHIYLAGLLTMDFDHKHSSGHILGIW